MPTTLRDLTKTFMMKDIESRSPEKILWFVELTETHTTETRNPQTGEKIKSPDWSIIRKLYAGEFYPELLKKVSKKSDKKPLTTAERLAKLKAKAEKTE